MSSPTVTRRSATVAVSSIAAALSCVPSYQKQIRVGLFASAGSSVLRSTRKRGRPEVRGVFASASRQSSASPRTLWLAPGLGQERCERVGLG